MYGLGQHCKRLVLLFEASASATHALPPQLFWPAGLTGDTLLSPVVLPHTQGMLLEQQVLELHKAVEELSAIKEMRTPVVRTVAFFLLPSCSCCAPVHTVVLRPFPQTSTHFPFTPHARAECVFHFTRHLLRAHRALWLTAWCIKLERKKCAAVVVACYRSSAMLQPPCRLNDTQPIPNTHKLLQSNVTWVCSCCGPWCGGSLSSSSLPSWACTGWGLRLVTTMPWASSLLRL